MLSESLVEQTKKRWAWKLKGLFSFSEGLNVEAINVLEFGTWKRDREFGDICHSNLGFENKGQHLREILF